MLNPTTFFIKVGSLNFCDFVERCVPYLSQFFVYCYALEQVVVFSRSNCFTFIYADIFLLHTTQHDFHLVRLTSLRWPIVACNHVFSSFVLSNWQPKYLYYQSPFGNRLFYNIVPVCKSKTKLTIDLYFAKWINWGMLIVPGKLIYIG